MSKKDIVIDFVMTNIQSGKYKENSKIMSEPMMCQYLGVSRCTVRDALKILEEKNIIYKIRGCGSFIKNIKSNLKYIVIAIDENKFFNENTLFFKNLIESLKTIIQSKGYIPYTHTEKSDFYKISETKPKNIEDYLSVNISEIAGLITIFGRSDYYSTLAKNQIPIVSLLDEYSKYPYVSINQRHFANKINKIIKKYKFRKVYFFILKVNEHLIKEKFEGIDFRYSSISSWSKAHDNYIALKEEIEKITDYPDLIVFTDESLYSSCVPLFGEYEMFRQAKIITHSNNNEIYPEGYSICRLTYYPEDFAKISMDILISLINKEIPEHFNYRLGYKTINEEALKKQ
ncbi:MAG: GntR family transcriptional regulator [Armatimonadetes bacterium]|nr:GntR family transcriptional regulator [Candidatus Hippobium faecium]